MPHEILVFTNMLAHADREGFVDVHFRAIADEVGLTIEQVTEAVKTLESPDPESRSPEEEGRRIVRVSDNRAWGWRIVNHGKYREIRNEEDRREQNRKAQERFRNKNKSSKVSNDKQPSAESAHTYASACTSESSSKDRGMGEGDEAPPQSARTPSLERCIEYLKKQGATFSNEVIRQAWQDFESTKNPETGQWLSGRGKMAITDWRPAIEKKCSLFQEYSRTGNPRTGSAQRSAAFIPAEPRTLDELNIREI